MLDPSCDSRPDRGDALRPSRDGFPFIAESIPQPVWILSADGAFEYGNGRWSSYVGAPGEAGWEDFIHPEDRESLRSRLAGLAADRDAWSCVLRLRRGRDGAHLPFDSRFEPISGEGDRPLRWVVIHSPIGAGTRPNFGLEGPRDEGMRAFLDITSEIVVRFDTEFRHIYVNPSVESATGLAPEAFLGKTNRELGMPVDLCDLWERKLREVIDSGRELVFEFDYESPTGRRNYRCRLVPEFGEDGGVKSILSNASDLTEQVKLALRKILDGIPTFIGIVGTDGTLIEVNASSLDAASLRREDVIGRPVEESYWLSYSTEVQALFREDVRRALAGEQVRHDLKIRLGEGRFTIVDFLLVPLADSTGRVTHLIGSATDIRERVESELKVRESEERLRLAAQAAGLAVAEIDYRADTVRLSPSAAALFGLPAEVAEISISRMRSLIHPEDQGDVFRQIDLAHRAGGTGQFATEYRVVGPDGQIRWHSVCKRVFFEEGKATRALLAMFEITARKEAEAERERLLKAAEQGRRLLGAVMEYVPEGLTISQSPDFGVRMISKFGLDMLDHRRLPTGGISLSEILDSIAVYHPDTLRPANPDELPLFRASVRGEQISDEEWLIVRTDGSQIPILCNAGPIRDDRGEIAGGIVAWRDITERKRIEEALQEAARRKDESLALLDSMLVNAPIGFAFFDRDHRVVRINETFAAIHGVLVEGLLGRPLREAIPSASAEVEAHVARVFDTGRPILDIELSGEGVDRAGRPIRRHFLAGYYPVPTPDGLTSIVGSMVMDISERKQAEEALKEADLKKDEFLAMLAHELRNPLSAITNAVGLMRLQGASPADIAWCGELIDRQSLQLTRLINDLLDISRISRGKIRIRPMPIDLRASIHQAVAAVRHHLDQKRQEISLDLPDGPLDVEADPSRIEQVVGNLLTNAAKYSNEGSSIRLEAREESGRVRLSVRDEGIGISPEQLPRIFDLFAQEDRSVARSEGGLGIGLTLVKSLVEMHGGEVTARSEGQGKGSEFVVRLPAAPANPAAPPDAGPAREANRGEDHNRPGSRVLVVEDSEDIARGMVKLLEVYGYSARIARDGPSALGLMAEFRPGVVLLDIGLPGMSGYEVASELRADARFENTTIIAISGYGQEKDRARGKAAGFDHHLLKPVDIDLLLGLLPRASGPGTASPPR